MMIDSLPPNKRGIGFNLQTVIVSLVSLPAPLIATALVLSNGSYVSPQLPFILLAAAAVPLSVVVLRKVFEPSVKEV
jgi:hypothetical protein